MHLQWASNLSRDHVAAHRWISHRQHQMISFVGRRPDRLMYHGREAPVLITLHGQEDQPQE